MYQPFINIESWESPAYLSLARHGSNENMWMSEASASQWHLQLLVCNMRAESEHWDEMKTTFSLPVFPSAEVVSRPFTWYSRIVINKFFLCSVSKAFAFVGGWVFVHKWVLYIQIDMCLCQRLEDVSFIMCVWECADKCTYCIFLCGFLHILSVIKATIKALGLRDS